MNLKHLSDDNLLTETKVMATTEREATLTVLKYLREVERRKLFLRRGFSSLFDYVVKELHYSEGSAQRRIASMRLMNAIPAIQKKIEDGVLPLSTLSQAQTFFRQEAITSPVQKMEVLERLEGKTSREVEKLLVCESTSPEKLIREKVRPLSESHHHLSLTISSDLLDKLTELKSLLAHRNPSMDTAKLLEILTEESLAKHRIKAPKLPPAPAAEAKNKLAVTGAVQKRSRNIPANIKRRIWVRDDGKCTYKDPMTGRSCESKHFLQVDHKVPFAAGGDASEENLRLLCFAHNQLAAVDYFGTASLRHSIQRRTS